jgi:hypothetical protein
MEEEVRFRQISEETIIIKTTPLEELESSRDAAIRNIMRIVDNHCHGDSHRHIRSVVLDSVNAMHRTDAETLERLLNKFDGKS